MKRGICILFSALLLAAPVPVRAQERMTGYEMKETPHTFTIKAGKGGLAKDGEVVALPEGAEPYLKEGTVMVAAEPFLKALVEDVSLEWDKFHEGILYVFWGNEQIAFDVNIKEVFADRPNFPALPGMERRGSQLFLPLREWKEILPEFYCQTQSISWDAQTRTATLQYTAGDLEPKGGAPIPIGEGIMPEYSLPPTQEYERIQSLGDGYFSAETGYPDNKTFILGDKGDVLQSYEERTSVDYVGENRFQILEYSPEKKVSYITDQNGKIIFQTESKKGIWFSEGLAQTTIKSGTGFPDAKGNIDWNIGFLDTEGNLAVPTGYYFAKDFSEGLAAVATVAEKTARRWWGYIDKEGALVIDTKYTSCGSFHEGLAYACSDDGLNGKYGYIDKTGREVIPPQYDWASDFYNGTAFVLEGRWMEDGRLWVIDRTGKKRKLLAETPVIVESARVMSPDVEGVVVVQNTARLYSKPLRFYTYYNADGEIPYAEVLWLQNSSDGLMVVQDAETGKWGYVDHDWHWVIAPVFDDAGNFRDGYAVVRQNVKQGDATIDSAWGIIKKP